MEHNELIVAFPCDKTIVENARLGLYYEWSSNPCKRNQRFIGVYKQKAIRYVGKVEAITVAFYKNKVEYPEKPEIGPLTSDHRTRIEMAFETLNFPLKDGEPRRFYLVDSFFRTVARKTSPGGMRSYRYFDLSHFVLSKIVPAYNPYKDYTSEELADILKEATWE